MRIGYQATLIALASIQIALASTGSATAIGASEPTPSASALSSPSVSPSVAGATASPGTSAVAELAAGLVRTNLTAVFDPIAVPARDGPFDGYRIRVGVRNSGPRSISAPAGVSAATFRLTLLWSGPSRSLGGCRYWEEVPPPIGGSRASAAAYECASGPALRVGQTYWESFFVTDGILASHYTRLVVDGYVEDPDPSDNYCDLAMRPGTGPGLPVTGARLTGIIGAGLTLVGTGVIVLWYGRRRRLTPSAGRARASDH